MITKTEFKNFIDLNNTNYDDAIDLIIAGVKKFLTNYCSNVLEQDTSIEQIFDDEDVLDYDLILDNRINVSSVVLYYNSGTEYVPVWTAEDTNNYLVYNNEGIITLDSVRSGRKIYKAVYSAGYSANSFPDDLKLATLKICSAVFNKRKSEGQGSESAEGYSVNFTDFLNSEVKNLLSPYKNTRI